jgi:hypothetical protein
MREPGGTTVEEKSELEQLVARLKAAAEYFDAMGNWKAGDPVLPSFDASSLAADIRRILQRPEQVAAEAYQVIGGLAHVAGLFEHPEVIRALDYFSGEPFDGSILPFGHGLPGAKGTSRA